MALIRIKDETTTCSTAAAADDYTAIDGLTNGTRRMLAATPIFTRMALGAGTISPNTGIYADYSSAATASLYGATFVVNNSWVSTGSSIYTRGLSAFVSRIMSATSDSVGGTTGAYITSKVEGGSGYTMFVIGASISAYHSSTGNISELSAVGSSIQKAVGSGVTDSAYGFKLSCSNSGGTITNAYGLFIGTLSGTTIYGIKVEDQGAGQYAIYTGTGKVRFGGQVQMANYGAGTATFDASGNITSSSDARKKDILRTFERGLADVIRITPKVFKWKAGCGLNTTEENAGFIAQDVQQAIPEAVGQDPFGYLSLSDRAILAALVNSVKELDRRTRAA